MMQSRQRVARQITAIAVKQVDISAYKGLSLNLPIMHTRRIAVEQPKESKEELFYSMELEAITVQLPTEQK
jgi:hypothetical protein